MGISGLVDVVNSPLYATGVGLVLWGARNRDSKFMPLYPSEGMFDRVVGRMKQWFAEAF
jgi:cell division protein FtsA